MIVIRGNRKPLRVSPLAERRLSATVDQGAGLGSTGSGAAYPLGGYNPCAQAGHLTVTVRYRGGHIPIVLGPVQG